MGLCKCRLHGSRRGLCRGGGYGGLTFCGRWLRRGLGSRGGCFRFGGPFFDGSDRLGLFLAGRGCRFLPGFLLVFVGLGIVAFVSCQDTLGQNAQVEFLVVTDRFSVFVGQQAFFFAFLVFIEGLLLDLCFGTLGARALDGDLRRRRGR